jgi:translation initiation factor 4E
MWKLILPSKMRSTDLDRMWLETLLSMIGESYGSLGDLICGAYLQRRQKEDRIQLWTTKGSEEEIKEIGAILKDKLNLSKESHIHYLKHEDQTGGQNAGKNMSWSRKHKSDSLYHI